MDPQQIRDEIAGWTDVAPTSDVGHLLALLTEYADLLEASERVWWCVTERHPYEGEIICCSRMVDTDCGWRLLVTERKS